MKPDRFAGRWKQLEGRAKRLWGRLTGNDKIQQAEGMAGEADEKRLAEWRERQHKSDPIHK